MPQKQIKRITVNVHGAGQEHEGFEVEHEYGQSGEGEYHPPKSMGVMKHHGEVMQHMHEHLKDLGSEGSDDDSDDCIMCAPSSSDSRGKPKMTEHLKKHPGFKSVQKSIASKEGLSSKAAGAILAARSRGASAGAHKANPRLGKVKG